MNLTRFSYSGALESPIDRRAKIERFEVENLKRPQVACPVRDVFALGLYARQMTIPPWTVLTGAVHKTEHLAILAQGCIEVETDDGLRMLSALNGPLILTSKAGIKRLGRTFEHGAVWITVHENADNCHDMEVLIERLTTSKYSDLLENRAAIEGGESWHLA